MSQPSVTGPDADRALVSLLARLDEVGYDFVTPTPSTHALVRGRAPAGEADFLRDVFGWVRSFQLQQMPDVILETMRSGGLLVETAEGFCSAMRVSRVDGSLFLHSAPGRDAAAVFLGPDSYRFARLLRQTARSARFERALDVGTGAGVGAVALKTMVPDAEVHASDINPLALRLARLNAEFAGRPILTRQASGLPAAPGAFDLIVANPPYIAKGGRIYSDGGDDRGSALALDWVRAGAHRLCPGGRFILYTGAPIVAGRDIVRDALTTLCAEQKLTLDYEEIDPDVFGQSLRQEAYQDVERIAAIGAVIARA